MLVVYPPGVATSPPIMPNLPGRHLHDLFGCSAGDWFIVLCLSVVSLVYLLCHFLEYRDVR